MIDRTDYQREYKKAYKSRVKRVNLTFSPSEYKRFQKTAKSDDPDTKLTSFVKTMALAGLDNRVGVPAELKEELNILRFAIRNIANNVNQIAHYSNTVRAVSTSDENNLFMHLKQLEDAIKDYTHGRLTTAKNDN